MCSWRRVAVARVFALVVRCRIMQLVVYSCVGKNRDTRRESPAGAGAGRTADHLTVLFSQKVLAVRKANCIYRPVSTSFYLRSIPVLFYTIDKMLHQLVHIVSQIQLSSRYNPLIVCFLKLIHVLIPQS